MSNPKHCIRLHGQFIWSLYNLDAAELLWILRYLVESYDMTAIRLRIILVPSVSQKMSSVVSNCDKFVQGLNSSVLYCLHLLGGTSSCVKSVKDIPSQPTSWNSSTSIQGKSVIASCKQAIKVCTQIILRNQRKHDLLVMTFEPDLLHTLEVGRMHQQQKLAIIC